MPTSTPLLFDAARSDLDWHTINDDVMGGHSTSSFTIEGDVAVFQGRVSLEDGGGFASVRRAEQAQDLSGQTGLRLRVRGDGRSYDVRLYTTDGKDRYAYRAPITPPTDAFKTLSVPFTAFEAVFRGRPVPDAPPFDPALFLTFGFLIAGGEAGPFRLEIAHVYADTVVGRP